MPGDFGWLERWEVLIDGAETEAQKSEARSTGEAGGVK